MASAGVVSGQGRTAGLTLSVAQLRLVLLLLILAAWEVMARSGLLYRDVVPSLIAIGGALLSLLASKAFSASS